MFWFFLLSIRALSDHDIQNILKTKDSQQEGYLCFIKMLNKFNSSTNLQIENKDNVITSTGNILKEMIFMGKAMSILTYDYLSLSSYYVLIITALFTNFQDKNIQSIFPSVSYR